MKDTSTRNKSKLECLIEISHTTKGNTVIPFVIEYLSLCRLGHNPNYIIGKMYAYYSQHNLNNNYNVK